MLPNTDPPDTKKIIISLIIQLSLRNQVKLTARNVSNIINNQDAFAPKPLALQLNTSDLLGHDMTYELVNFG